MIFFMDCVIKWVSQMLYMEGPILLSPLTLELFKLTMNLFLFYFHNLIILNKETKKSIY
jgi:hypothetical protein